MRLIPSIVMSCLFGCVALLMPIREASSESNVLEKLVLNGPCTGFESNSNTSSKEVTVKKIGATLFFRSKEKGRDFFIIPYLINNGDYKYLLGPNEDLSKFIPICGTGPAPSADLKKHLENSRKYVLEYLEYYPILVSGEKINGLVEEINKGGIEEKKIIIGEIPFAEPKLQLKLKDFLTLIELYHVKNQSVI